MAFHRRPHQNDYGYVIRFPDESFNQFPNALSQIFQDSSNSWNNSRLNVELHEEHDSYVVEAEVPGYRKEDIQVHVGDNGRSITISGTVTKGQQSRAEPQAQAQSSSQPQQQSNKDDATVSKRSDENRIGTSTAHGSSFLRTSSFSRTVWLPRPVNGKAVSAKLDHGVLSLRVPKRDDEASVRVSID